MRHTRAADELDDHVNIGVVDDLVEVGSKEMPDAMRLGLSLIERAHAHDLDVDSVMALEVLAVVVDDVQAPSADGSRADKAYSHCHGEPFVPLRFRMTLLYQQIDYFCENPQGKRKCHATR